MISHSAATMTTSLHGAGARCCSGRLFVLSLHSLSEQTRPFCHSAFSSDLRMNAQLPMQGGVGSIPGQGTEVPMLSTIRV